MSTVAASKRWGWTPAARRRRRSGAWRQARGRLLTLPILLVGIVFVVFMSVHLAPGDPARVLAGVTANQHEIDHVRQVNGLDKPLVTQFGTYLGHVVQGDLGHSFVGGQSVMAELRQAVPASLELTLFATLIGLPLGLALGVAAARRRNSAVDDAARGIALVGLSIPPFWLGLLLAFVFSVLLGWLPFGGQVSAFSSVHRVTGFATVDALLGGDPSGFWDALRYLVLPTLTLAVIPLAIVARFARAAFIEILGEDHIRTMRAFGVEESRIVWRYAAKNAMLPLVTVVGLLVPALLAGSVLVEATYSRPGIGTLLLNAITTRDYPVLQGVTLVFALIYVTSSLLVDLTYGALDPRTRTRSPA